jgi:hypothetical protein
MTDDVLGSFDSTLDVQLYGLSAVVYAERGKEILLLKRAGGALAGQWFLPGGAVERNELPEDGARRELIEESGSTSSASWSSSAHTPSGSMAATVSSCPTEARSPTVTRSSATNTTALAGSTQWNSEPDSPTTGSTR